MDLKMSHSLAKFAFNFCNELDKSKTTICSPLSAEIVLGMTALGCKGQSHAELMQALDIPDDEAIRSSFAYLTATLRGIKSVTLNMANKLYIKKGGELKPGIKKDAEEVFKSSPEQLDFSESEAAAGTINKWAAEKTNNLIKEVVSAEQFDEETRLVLVNAIYFKGNWKIPFPVNNTQDRNFHVNKTIKIKVPMMYRGDTRFKYGVLPHLKAKVLSMDYQGDEASMVIVLPDDVDGLTSVVQLLADGHDLMSDIGKLRAVKTDVMIPKFKVEMTIDLKNLLQKMGIKAIFNKFLSDIDMLTSNERLFVSEAVQKAYIVVDETGTEAAAVTAAVGHRFRSAMIPEPPKRFIADRPFLYLLTVRNIPVFVGVYEGSQFGVNSSTSSFIIREKLLSARIPKRFIANQPFLYLLTVRSIPFFIGVYEGSQFGVSSL